MDFAEALRTYGFTAAQERSARDRQTYSASPNRFLTYWVHAYDDATALFTWEFAITDYLEERGMQIGAGEALNDYLYPQKDERGPQEAAWLAHAVEVTESLLRSVDLSDIPG